MVRCRDHGKGADSNHIHLCHLVTYIRYIIVTSVFSVTMKAWLLLSVKAPQKTQLWCTSYILYSFSLHTLTLPLQLHTYQEWQIQLLTTSLMKNKHLLTSPTLPCLHNQLTYNFQSPILSALKIRLEFPSIPTAVPRNLNIALPNISTLLTQ